MEAETIWNESLQKNIIIFLVATLLPIAIAFVLFGVANIANISNNWPEYRCNPGIMPFAGFFGYDARENLQFCMENVLKDQASSAFGPIYQMLYSLTSVMGSLTKSANSQRFLLANLFNGVNNFTGNVRTRIAILMNSIRRSFLKINNLMSRVYATFFAIIFMGTSAMTTGINIADNDLVKFLFFFCFHPYTPINMADGSIKPIKDVVIGEVLENGAKVTSVMRFDGHRTPMVSIDGIIVSERHLVLSISGGWIFAKDHPNAKITSSIPELICINTTTNEIPAGGHIWSDYRESNDPKITKEIHNKTIKTLNGKASFIEPINTEKVSPTKGISPHFKIKLENGTIAKIGDLKPGMKLFNGTHVMGVIEELCQDVIRIPTINDYYMAASQLIWDAHHEKWIKACEYFTQSKKEPIILHHIIVDKSNTIEVFDDEYTWTLRDYREIDDWDMEKIKLSHLGVKEVV